MLVAYLDTNFHCEGQLCWSWFLDDSNPDLLGLSVTFCVTIGDITIIFLQFHHCVEKQKYRKKIKTKIGMAEVSTTSWSVFAQVFIQNLREYQMKFWSKLMVVTGINSYNVRYFKTFQLHCLLEWDFCCHTSKLFHTDIGSTICIKEHNVATEPNYLMNRAAYIVVHVTLAVWVFLLAVVTHLIFWISVETLINSHFIYVI